jgi:tetratricopeptide (TPR) repeat protein
MMLSPKSTNEPLKPFAIMDGQRSAIPDDFSEADITFFTQIVDAIDDPWLKARLADIIWLKQRPREIRFALMAIDSYRNIPLNAETWVHDSLDCWERAIMLARSLNAGAGSRLKDIESEVIEKFNAATEQDGFFALRLADLLEANHLGRDNPSAVAQKLELLASVFKSKGELHRAREYYTTAAKWFKAANDDAKWVEMTVSVAECFVEEADARISSDKPSHIAANMFYEDAIKTYRIIPRDKRGTHNVDERLAELHRRLSESGEKSVGEMGKISSPAIDIRPEIEKACMHS